MNEKQPPDKKDEEEKEPVDVDLRHTFNYVGGAFAYKNSKNIKKSISEDNFRETIMMIGYGKARKVSLAMPDADKRAGVFPQHNSVDEFKTNLELLPSRDLQPYEVMVDVETLEKNNFQLSIVPITKDRLSKLQKQLSHMSPYAFNQMMDIPRPDKRDFKVYYKIIKKTRQIITVYPHRKSLQSLFAQVVQYDEENHVNSIKHCSFDNNAPYILNESKIDKFGNLRQIAHVGRKGGGIAQNSVERFDDGTLIWVITQEKETGAAALKPNDEVVFVGNVINNAAKLAARNMGAEVVIGNAWGGRFCPSGCRPECHPMQQNFKAQVRLQINQIIDGATIPGLDPIFKINPPF
ncbi:MAG: hypothetical protein KGO93_06250 [Cyanobacteria bacterium REEB446]|nr:hypothetical protein [Cyanobacteria bacterium REEB446]